MRLQRYWPIALQRGAKFGSEQVTTRRQVSHSMSNLQDK